MQSSPKPPLPLVFCLLFGLCGHALGKAIITERTFSVLAQVREMIAAGQFENAGTRLAAIDTAAASSYEKALILQTRGHLYARAGRHPDAIRVLRNSLDANALPEAAAQNARYLLIQMLAAVADWKSAASETDAWLAAANRPSADAHALAGAIYAQVKRSKQAAEHLEKALDRAEQPPELWFRQLAAVHVGAKQYAAAAALLTDMVRRFPNRMEYWMQLADAYRVLGREGESLALLELAYRRDPAFDEGELLEFTDLLEQEGLPHRAGSILEHALHAGKLHSTGENWARLSKAWSRAGEVRLALRAAETALDLSPSAELQLMRAHLAAQVPDWPLALQAAGAALACAGLSDPGAAHLLRGTALHHLDREADSREAFQQASAFDTARDQARSWIEFLSPSNEAVRDAAATSPAAARERVGG